MTTYEKCPTCLEKAHDFEKGEFMDCVPPRDVLTFGQHHIDKKYRDALFERYPFYTTEEIVGSFLGHNPHFPSQTVWLEELEEQNESDY